MRKEHCWVYLFMLVVEWGRYCCRNQQDSWVAGKHKLSHLGLRRYMPLSRKETIKWWQLVEGCWSILERGSDGRYYRSIFEHAGGGVDS
jgi:hypothetical protein